MSQPRRLRRIMIGPGLSNLIRRAVVNSRGERNKKYGTRNREESSESVHLLPGPSSRCCRPTTPPAISPRWSSASRSASPSRLTPSARNAAARDVGRRLDAHARRKSAEARRCSARSGSAPRPEAARSAVSVEVASAASARRCAPPAGRPPRPSAFESAQARRLHLHGVRHVHGDPGHPDRLGLAVGNSGRPFGVADEITWVQTSYLDRRSDHDPAFGISVARLFHPHRLRRSRPPASR